MWHSLEIKGQDWELMGVEFFARFVAKLPQEVLHCNPLLGTRHGLGAKVCFLVCDHVPHIAEKEAFTAWVENCSLFLIKVESSNSSKVQEYDYCQVPNHQCHSYFQK